MLDGSIERACYEAGAKAMKAAIEAKLRGWQEWIAKDGCKSHDSQMTLCAYAGARTVVQLTPIPNIKPDCLLSDFHHSLRGNEECPECKLKAKDVS